jgi:hypothetical protein
MEYYDGGCRLQPIRDASRHLWIAGQANIPASDDIGRYWLSVGDFQ